MRPQYARRLIVNSVNRGTGWLEYQGGGWFKSNFLTAVSALVNENDYADRALLTDAYYHIGDIHLAHHAPHGAIRAYRDALACNPQCAPALREIGDIYYLMGDFGKARQYHELCLSQDASDIYALETLTFLRSMHRSGSSRVKPVYIKGDIYWEASELLAAWRPDDVLELLDPKRKRSVNARRFRAMAHGVRGDLERVLAEWAGIGRARDPIELSLEDFFYLSDAVWDAPEFWKILRSSVDRLSDLGLLPLGLLRDLPALGPRSGASLRERRRTNRHKVIIDYHIHRINGDIERLRALSARFPSWAGPRELLAYYAKHGRMPPRLTAEQKGFTVGTVN